MNHKRKRDGEDAVGAEENSTAALLMAEMKAALDRNTSHIMTQMQNKCLSMQNEIDGMNVRLSRMDELEDRCNHLESRCGSLERTLHNVTTYGQWKYSASIPSRSSHLHPLRDFDEDEIQTMDAIANCMKGQTCNLKDESGGYLTVSLDVADTDVNFMGHHDVLLPHWQELADAMQLFQQPDHSPGAIFHIVDIKLVPEVQDILANSLRRKKIKEFCFGNNHFEGENEGIDFVVQLLKQNPVLTKFSWTDNVIHNQRGADSLAGALSRLSYLKEINIDCCCYEGNVDGYELLCNVLKGGHRFLKCLKFDSMYIRTCGDTRLFDFIATNNSLETLGLFNNALNDRDASMLSDALKHNTTLKRLRMGDNEITDVGCVCFAEALAVNSTLDFLHLGSNPITFIGCRALERAVFDQSSLNKVADSNNVCQVAGIDPQLEQFNSTTDERSNRRGKIHRVLFDRNKIGTNVYHLNKEMVDEESLKLVPKVLAMPALRLRLGRGHRSLSIMYELLRNWKMPSLYETHHK